MSSRYFVNELDDFGLRSTVVALDRNRLLSNLQRTIQTCYLKHVDTKRPSVYTGSSGVAYALWHILRVPEARSALSSGMQEPLNGTSALEMAQKAIHCLERRPTPYPWSLMAGEGGAYVVAALCAAHQKDQQGRREALEHAVAYASLAPLAIQCKEDEVLYGKAGYLLGCLLLNKHVAKDVVSMSVLQDLSASVLNAGIMQARKLPPSPGLPPLWWEWHGVAYLGAAHGFMGTGILYVLLHVPPLVLEAAVSGAGELIQKTLQYILRLECDDDGGKSNIGKGGHFPIHGYTTVDAGGKPDTDRSRCLVHWCHGAPGAIFVFSRAYSIYSQRPYIDAALRAGEVVWKQGLLKKGPGACHGISGNAYALLELYNLTGDKKWFYRASQFASFMDSEQFRQGTQLPDHPFSLFEGWAACACLYADLLVAEQRMCAAFPLYGSALLI